MNPVKSILSSLGDEIRFFECGNKEVNKFRKKVIYIAWLLGLPIFAYLLASSISLTNVLLLALLAITITFWITFRWMIFYRFSALRYLVSVDQKTTLLQSMGIPYDLIREFISLVENDARGEKQSEFISLLEKKIYSYANKDSEQ